MAFSYHNYTGDNSTTTFSIPFTYTDTSEISVTVDGVAETGLTFPSSSEVTLTSAPASGTLVQVRRTTTLTSRTVDFASGSVLTEEDLDNSNIQVFHAAQEAVDTAGDAITLGADDKWDAQSKVIKNVAAPVANTDAVNKQFISTNLPNISTVAGINTEVTTVAGIASDVTTVAGINANVTTVATNDTNVSSVGTNITNVNKVAAIDANITTVAAIDANITTVAGVSTEVTSVAGVSSLITADFVSDLNTLATAPIVTDLDALADLSTEIDALGDITSAISGVNSNSSNINAVASNETNINLVAADIGTIATKANAGANSDITSLSGLTTALSVAQGGTGATSASAARTALDLEVGVDVQAFDADIVAKDVTNVFTKAQVPSTYTGSALTLDFDTYQNFIITLAAGSNTLAAPSTEAGNVGQTGTIIFINPSSGAAATLSLHGDYESVGGAGLTISATNDAYDVVPYIIKADNSILLGAPQLGFA